ncbi:hypothetical protein B0H14DRAFT_2571457 [Mycena olivaceomarginata]|nr:hypothetical protein B0H14DRAFT_2571457 [Mycena olivaceomarginata]
MFELCMTRGRQETRLHAGGLRRATRTRRASESAPPSKKRKITPTGHAGGRVPKGKDFWSQADAFCARKIAEFGSKNLQGSGWKEYANETLQLDEFRFPSATDEEFATSNPSSSTPSSAAPTNVGSRARSNLIQLV